MKAKVKGFIEKHERGIRNATLALLAVGGGLAGYKIGHSVGALKREDSWREFLSGCCLETPELYDMLATSTRKFIERTNR